MHRRNILKAAGVAAGSTVLPGCSTPVAEPPGSANSRLDIALVGSGGWIAQHAYRGGIKEENLVAFCDVDRNHCAENMKAWRTDQPFFDDYRRMFDKMWKGIDAVVVSVPDHSHFGATLAAMERGIHVYTQKPLTHNIWEARTLRKAREKYGVMTQMGNQGHAGGGIRLSVEAYRSGLIGEVAEVHAWNAGPNYDNRHFKRVEAMPPVPQAVPSGLSWDLWLGPATPRPYNDVYLPKSWRGFYDFGLGMLGDFGCHTLDMPVWALELGPPSIVECVERRNSPDGVVPSASILDFYFPAKGTRGPVKLRWYEGSRNDGRIGRIDRFGIDEIRGGGGAFLVGEKGLIQSGTHAGMPRIYPVDKREHCREHPPEQLFPRVEGGPFREWIRAIKGDGPEPGSNFEYSARLTEIILCGVLAQRFNTRIEWDAANQKVTNHPELSEFVKEPAREGWRCGEDLA